MIFSRIIFVLLLMACSTAQAQQMVYLKGGKVSLDKKIIRRTWQLKKVLKKQNSEELMRMYKQYAWKRYTERFFLTLMGLGLTYSTSDEFTPNPKINWPFVGLAAGSAISAELFHRPASRSLKEIVEFYNEEIYLQSLNQKLQNQ